MFSGCNLETMIQCEDYCTYGEWNSTATQCNASNFACHCYTATNTACFVHASSILPSYFIILQIVQGIVFLFALVCSIAILYLHNKSNKSKRKVLNVQFGMIAIALFGTTFFGCEITILIGNLVFLPGFYGSWQLYGTGLNAVAVASVMLSVQILFVMVTLLTGYLFW